MADLVLRTAPLGMQWPTIDPFLFCAHHHDAYPVGTADRTPAASLAGRRIGQDFDNVDGWNMYHGSKVPGFPAHPHRGFETVTYVRTGLIDHSDSLGARARFGRGDTQWLTAGRGVVHCEMFPLVHTDQPNPLELFQIWLNLPAADKMVDPYFTMLWSETTPRVEVIDHAGRRSEVTVVAGTFDGVMAQSPPPDSWASRPDADLAILHLVLSPDASLELPAATGGGDTGRALYLFEGSMLELAPVSGGGGVTIESSTAAFVDAGQAALLTAGPDGAEVLMLQGRPIAEPVAMYGPFVMNTRAEIEQAFSDYHATQFGGWPWPTPDPDHGSLAAAGRFAVHPDGRHEQR